MRGRREHLPLDPGQHPVWGLCSSSTGKTQAPNLGTGINHCPYEPSASHCLAHTTQVTEKRMEGRKTSRWGGIELVGSTSIQEPLPWRELKAARFQRGARKSYYSHLLSPGRVTSNGPQCFFGKIYRYLGSSSPRDAWTGWEMSTGTASAGSWSRTLTTPSEEGTAF